MNEWTVLYQLYLKNKKNNNIFYAVRAVFTLNLICGKKSDIQIQNNQQLWPSFEERQTFWSFQIQFLWLFIKSWTCLSQSAHPQVCFFPCISRMSHYSVTNWLPIIVLRFQVVCLSALNARVRTWDLVWFCSGLNMSIPVTLCSLYVCTFLLSSSVNR